MKVSQSRTCRECSLVHFIFELITSAFLVQRFWRRNFGSWCATSL